MGQIVQQGALNIAALQVPDVYVQIVPPQLLLNGIPTNVVGFVGTASWGPVGSPAIVGGYSNYSQQFGDMVNRKYDMGSHVWNAYQQGSQLVARCVRATDGSDVAAAITILTNCLTVTSKYSGSKGNLQTIIIGNGAAANSKRVTVNTPGVLSEVFDNILQGIGTLTATAGTNYTSVPALSIAAPDIAGGVQATASASLVTYGTPTVGAGGTGYVVGDTITLANGVVVKVATVSSGAVATFAAQGTAGTVLGSITSGAVPANPVAQVSTSGAGTGATVALTWGVGPATLVQPGTGYTTSAPVVTLTGGGGAGGAYVSASSYWPNIANAINLGQGGLRGPSQNVVATAGVGTTAPTSTTYTLAGGSDGASVNGSTLLGVDTLPRRGMYALRGSAASVVMLADCDDSTTWSQQVSYGLSEGSYMIATGPSGDTITNAASVKATAGIDSYAMKLMLGDWVFFNDTINGLTRMISPQGFVAGVLGNLAPNQSSLNKPMQGLVGTQKSSTGVPYTSADIQTLALAGIDCIANPIPRGAGFGTRLGHNTSSNASIRGDNYTRMTNFIASTIAGGMGIYIGTLQTADQQKRAKATLDYFFANLQAAGLIGGANPAAGDPWQVVLDASNNPLSMVALGVEQAYCKVQYLSVVEELVISIEGGQSVQIQRTTQAFTG